ncbi:hypothetical protein QWY85_08930 [Neolewinella lacunae]|uniref:LysM peptidoglycan-binding domain-containing protein n=1 Tax=Neolewinella lacunae TaxID=1517758 RepID=A0A923T9E8_9BACT|nr:tail protein X [Neolewinella lacunae]MBC6996655.1 LysM peptidoglycan-binding domain-containing protein [Neolewinella lacunae]MDN3634780.1 hypothetical protein [Neolewinella lacunae]
MAQASPKADRKLRIWAYADKNFSQLVPGVKNPLEVSINPSGYKRTFKPLKAGKPAITLANGEIADIKIVDPPPEIFQVELWFDATGAVPGTGEVTDDIELLKKHALLYNGDIHSTNFVKLEWGGTGGLLFKGQLQSLNVDYSLFDRKGKPLRAKALATFVEFIDAKTRESLKKKNSPDLTHVRTVGAGDTLPLMCYRIYGDSAYYVQVAAANQLASVLDLRPGQRIVFPPINN